MKMTLSINKINELLTVVLPMAIDAMRPVSQPVGRPIMLPSGQSYAFALDLKVRDVTNRRHLNQAWAVFTADREALSVKYSGRPDLLPESHKNFKAWQAEVEELARETVEVQLYPYKLSTFQFEKNETYPSENISLLSGYGLVDYDLKVQEDPEEAPAAPRKASAPAQREEA